ncbi:MAG: hypothetical protein AAF928_03430 [Myxococcota bacterium]
MNDIVMQRRAVLRALGLWTATVIVFAVSDGMRLLPPPGVPVLIFGSTLLMGRVLWRRGPRALMDLDLRIPIALHVLRLPVGLWFIALGAEGLLDPRFVTVAGYGDIVAGALAALALVAITTAGANKARAAVLAFNVVGTLDILAVLFTAQRIILFDGGLDAMRGMFALPGPMIPAWLVPLVLMTHALVFLRLRKANEAPALHRTPEPNL